MNYETYEKLITEVLQDSDKAPLIVKDMLDKLKGDVALYQEQSKTVEEQIKQIKKLQEVNLQLMLTSTSAKPKAEEPEEELTGDDAINAFFKKHNI